MTDQDRLDHFAKEFMTQIELALPAWVVGAVLSRLTPSRLEQGRSLAQIAGQEAIDHLRDPLRELLSQDIDEQRTTPLSLVREAVPFATTVLVELGVDPVGRDGAAMRLHPADIYDLTPGGFAEFGEPTQQASLCWGAAKAHIHIQRRHAEGKR